MLEFQNAVILNSGFEVRADWSLPAGSLCAVTGPSGAGKSTILQAIAGFLPLKSGAIVWQGNRLDLSPPEARPAALIFQDNNLFPHLSAGANITLARKGISRAMVETALADVGLEGLAERKPADLSGGQQARVTLARSLLMERPLLLMDEPFSALGPGQRREMLDLVVRLAHQKAMTLLMVTHEPRDLDLLDHVVMVDAGLAAPPVERAAFLAAPPPAWLAYIGQG